MFRIARIDAFAAVLPLTTPVKLATITIRHCDNLIVRIADEDLHALADIERHYTLCAAAGGSLKPIKLGGAFQVMAAALHRHPGRVRPRHRGRRGQAHALSERLSRRVTSCAGH